MCKSPIRLSIILSQASFLHSGVKPSVIQSVAVATAAPCLSLLLLTQQAVNNTRRVFNNATATDILRLRTTLQPSPPFHEFAFPLPAALLQPKTSGRFWALKWPVDPLLLLVQLFDKREEHFILEQMKHELTGPVVALIRSLCGQLLQSGGHLSSSSFFIG